MVFTMVGPGDFRQVKHLDIRSFSTVLLFKYLRALHFATVSNSVPYYIHEKALHFDSDRFFTLQVHQTDGVEMSPIKAQVG